MIRFLFKQKFFGASKTTPVDADSVVIVDSADSSIVKKTTWANIKSTLASVFVLKTAVPWSQQIACSDLTTALTTGTGKAYFRIPYGVTLTAVRASLFVAQTSGSIFTVDINENGTTILSTKLTIDNTEKTSVTAVTPAVISDTSLTDDSEITFDIDQVGDGTAKGLIITLIGTISI